VPAEQEVGAVGGRAVIGRRLSACSEVHTVEPDAQPFRPRAGITSRFDADVEPLPRCKHPTIGRHDANVSCGARVRTVQLETQNTQQREAQGMNHGTKV
jgi:hypothetical protein